MRNWKFASAVFALSAIAALPASAAPLLFSYTPTTDPSGAFTFNVDSQPTPVSYGPGSFSEVSITNATGQYKSFATTVLQSSAEGGGFDNYFGAQFYTGSESAPTILTGTFNILNNDSLNQAGVLTISAVTGAVPEPATWALMILGMGAIGYTMRRRKVTARISFAA